MREALLIFRKDIRQQRVPLALFLVLVAARTVIDALLPHYLGLVAAQTVLGILFVMAAVGLAYTVTQQERVAGDCQYWLTRPLPWRGVLTAKVLFFGLLILLPTLLGSAMAMALNGVSPGNVWNLLPTLAVIGLTVVAVASVTRSTVQFILTLVGFLVLLVLSMLVLILFLGYENNDWGSAGGVRSGADALFFTGLLAVATVWQYRDRRTGRSRGLLSISALVMLFGLPGWRAAFAYLEKVEGPGASRTVQLAFNAARGPQGQPGNWSYWPAEDVVGVKLPIEITGIPDGAMLMGQRVRTTLDTPDGRHWDSGWRFFGGVVGDENPGAGAHKLSGNESARWLAVNIDRAFFDSVRNTPLRLQATAAFTMLSPPDVAHLPVPCRARAAAPGEFCSVSSRNGIITVACVASFGADSVDPGRVYRIRQGEHVREAVPAGSSPMLSAWIYESATAQTLEFTPTEVEIESRRTAGYFDRTLTIDRIQLGPYEVGRSTGPRGWGEPVRNIP